MVRESLSSTAISSFRATIEEKGLSLKIILSILLYNSAIFRVRYLTSRANDRNRDRNNFHLDFILGIFVGSNRGYLRIKSRSDNIKRK